MNIRYLKEFAELAECLNYTKASKRLNMSQPTLSKHIQALEDELHLKLMDRSTTSGAKLTDAGYELLQSVYEIIDAYDYLMSNAERLRKTPPSRLIISGISGEDPSTQTMGYIVSQLGDKYGTDFLEINNEYNKTPEQIISEKKTDVVFDPRPVSPGFSSNVHSVEIARLPMIAFVSSKSPLAQYDEISFEQFRDLDFIKYEGVYQKNYWYRVEQAIVCRKFNTRIKSRYFPNVAALLSACASLGPSVLVLGSNFETRLPQGLEPYCKCLRLIDDDAYIPMHLSYCTKNKNPLLQSLIEEVESPDFVPLQL